MRSYACLAALFSLFCCVTAQAQLAGERAGGWEAGFHIVDASSVFVADAFGASLDVDSDIGYGFTGGYNFSNRFAVLLDYTWSSPDYVATFAPDGPGLPVTIATRLDVTTIQAKGVFYLLEGEITPFVEVGLGWTNIDSNIISSAPITGCWWDPFWGYICETYYDTYDQTETSYSAGIGLRWDFSPELMMRVSVGTLELDLDSGDDPSVDTMQLDVAWRF